MSAAEDVSAPRVRLSRVCLSRGGLIAAIILTVVFVIWWAALEVSALFLGFVSDSCGENSACNYTELEVGTIVAFFVTAAVGVVFMVMAIVKMVRRRRLAWLWPLIGGVAILVVWVTGATISYAAAGMSFWNEYWM
jgi:hypothetical protein